MLKNAKDVKKFANANLTVIVLSYYLSLACASLQGN